MSRSSCPFLHFFFFLLIEQAAVLFCDFWNRPSLRKVWPGASDGRLPPWFIFTHLHYSLGKKWKHSTVQWNLFLLLAACFIIIVVIKLRVYGFCRFGEIRCAAAAFGWTKRIIVFFHWTISDQFVSSEASTLVPSALARPCCHFLYLVYNVIYCVSFLNHLPTFFFFFLQNDKLTNIQYPKALTIVCLSPSHSLQHQWVAVSSLVRSNSCPRILRRLWTANTLITGQLATSWGTALQKSVVATVVMKFKSDL